MRRGQSELEFPRPAWLLALLFRERVPRLLGFLGFVVVQQKIDVVKPRSGKLTFGRVPALTHDFGCPAQRDGNLTSRDGFLLLGCKF